MEQPPASQASSHFSLEPISAAVLADRGVVRRDGVKSLGKCRTGCADLDNYMLLGGLERGCVVGISAEEEDIGVQLGLQTLGHSLCDDAVKKCLVITPRPPATILGALRDGFRAELVGRKVPATELNARVRTCLDRVMLSCVFDLDGLWEVLADLDKATSSESSPARAADNPTPQEKEKEEKEMDKEPPPVLEIQDSEDEGFSSAEETEELPTRASPKQQPEQSLPDMIVVTHFSSIMTSLFTHREKSAAHAALQLLASHLHYLSRNLPTSPLILLLNSTTTPDTAPSKPHSPVRYGSPQRGVSKAMDQTLRSIFHPPPPPSGYGYPTAAAAASTMRRVKPSFGLVFSQLLDLHMLVTRVPRGKDDAESMAAEGGGQVVQVVEVLLDDMGVWEGRRGTRKNREQRWGAVVVDDNGRVRDAFGRNDKKDLGDVRLAAGFGGPRV